MKEMNIPHKLLSCAK